MTTDYQTDKDNAIHNPHIVISTVKNVEDKRPVRVETSWLKCVDALHKPKQRGALTLVEYLQSEKSISDKQKNGKGIICGEFRKPDTRSKVDLKALYIIPLDLDDGFYTADMLQRALADFECVIVTSYSNNPDKPKLRVYILLAHPIVNEIELTINAIIDYFEALLGKHIDPKSRTVNQLFFTPSYPPGGKDFFQFIHNTGNPLDPSPFHIVEETVLKKPVVRGNGERPGDDFNERSSIREIIEPYGWKFSHHRNGIDYFTRPGKNHGVSACYFRESGLFYVFSSSTVFDPDKAYSKFAAYTLLAHGGDFQASARELSLKGYGENDVNPDSEQFSSFPPLYMEKTEKLEQAPFDLSRLTLGSNIADGDYTVNFVVDKLLPEDAIILLYAKGGSGKSTLATQIGGAVESGNPFMGLNTSRRPVVIIDYENPLSVLGKRIKAVEGAGNVYFWTGGQNPPQLNKAAWRELKALVAALQKPLVIIDTLSSSCSGLDILSNGDFSPVMQRIIELRNMGATIVLLHHTPKQDETKYIGASRIYNQCDHILAMYPVKTAGVEKEATDEDDAKVYRLGTKDKTRFEHFTMYVEFDEDKCAFVTAADPDKEILDRIEQIIREQSAVNQTEIVNQIGAAVSKGKLTRLLKHNEGRKWTVERGERNAKIYRPIQFSSFSPLYSRETEKLNSSCPTLYEKQIATDTPQTLFNSEFASIPGGDGKLKNRTTCDQDTPNPYDDGYMDSLMESEVPNLDDLDIETEVIHEG